MTLIPFAVFPARFGAHRAPRETRSVTREERLFRATEKVTDRTVRTTMGDLAALVVHTATGDRRRAPCSVRWRSVPFRTHPASHRDRLPPRQRSRARGRASIRRAPKRTVRAPIDVIAALNVSRKRRRTRNSLQKRRVERDETLWSCCSMVPRRDRRQVATCVHLQRDRFFTLALS